MSEAKKTGLSNATRREAMHRAAGEAPAKRPRTDKYWFHHIDTQRSSVAKKVRGLRIFSASVSVEVEPSFHEQNAITDTVLDVVTGKYDREKRARVEGESATA